MKASPRREDWNLPSWYHSDSAQKLNWTTINKVNEMSKAVADERRRGAPDPIVMPRLRRDQTSPESRPQLESDVTHPSDTIMDSDFVDQHVSSGPRFPEHHPLWQELYLLQSAAAVIHFSAVGKPWTVSNDLLRSERPDAHPLLGEQFLMWSRTADSVCPAYGSPESYE